MTNESSPSASFLANPLVRGGLAALIIVGIVVGVLAVRSSRGDSAGEDSTSTTPTADETPYPGDVFMVCADDIEPTLVAGGPPVIGQPAPDFALCDEGGQFVKRISDMKGQVVWLNFWATWCVPCKKELPDIQALYDEMNGDGLEVLIVNYRESVDEALAFLPPLGISLPVVLDSTGSVYEEYRLAGLPDSFFIGRDGNVAAVYYGFVNEEIARERLAKAGLESTP